MGKSILLHFTLEGERISLSKYIFLCQYVCPPSVFSKPFFSKVWGTWVGVTGPSWIPGSGPFLGEGARAGSVVLSNGKAPGSLFSARVPAPALR